MKLGLIVHGPYIIDSGHALKIINLLKSYAELNILLGGTMGRTAVIDANLEDTIDISAKRLPSESLKILNNQNCDIMLLLNSGKSRLTGHTFGYKVFSKINLNKPFIQIERPYMNDGSIIPWIKPESDFHIQLSKLINLPIIESTDVIKDINKKSNYTITEDKNNNILECRNVLGVDLNENIFVNGIVIGKSNSENITIHSKNGIITDIVDGIVKHHGIEKLGKINLETAVIKTGLLRRSKITPRIKQKLKNNDILHVAFSNHAAEDIYEYKDMDLVVCVGDDTTLIAADILYRFNTPIIGITDGDLDKIVLDGFKSEDSVIFQVSSGFDDIIGDIVFKELFNMENRILIDNIEDFKFKILEIISKNVELCIIK